jgi:hypothetical protein
MWNVDPTASATATPSAILFIMLFMLSMPDRATAGQTAALRPFLIAAT